jgi:hypothetical protein
VPSSSNPAGPHPLSGTAPDTVLSEEDVLRPQHLETVVWFDPMGHPIGRKTGQPSLVGFTAAELTTMKDATLTHNHPLGWAYPATDPRRAGNSFSENDFHFAVAADVAELRVVTPLLRFSAERPPGGWPVSAALIRLFHLGHASVVDAELELAVATGRLTLEQRQATLYHVAAQRLSTQLGIRYARWER